MVGARKCLCTLMQVLNGVDQINCRLRRRSTPSLSTPSWTAGHFSHHREDTIHGIRTTGRTEWAEDRASDGVCHTSVRTGFEPLEPMLSLVNWSITPVFLQRDGHKGLPGGSRPASPSYPVANNKEALYQAGERNICPGMASPTVIRALTY